MSDARPLPAIDDVNREYWEGCARHELLAQRCDRCERLRFPPRPMCPHCSSLGSLWTRLSGEARVVTWTICHPPVLPAFESQVPYAVVLVELAEGLRMISSLVDCPPEEIQAGMAVDVVFDAVSDDVTLPRFARACRS
jgi:uncharacterized protein